MQHESTSADWVQAGQQFFQSILAGQSAGGALSVDPARVSEIQRRWMEQHAALWQRMLVRGAATPEAGQAVRPPPGDRRFSAEAWSRSAHHDYLRQAYLINAGMIDEAVDALLIDSRARERLRFAVRQLVDMMSPANFIATNPDALDLALQTRGESLTRGLQNLIEDVRRGRVSTTDETRFDVGVNLATTPGTVVHENELIQLIQYAPLTATVAVRPLVIVPPCINKYYILDLTEQNSFVRHAVSHGHTVFMLSWRNITEAEGGWGWDDYLRLGPIEALRVASEISGVGQVNALGFCVGGTILAAALAVLRARGEDPAASLTLLASMLDFSDTGEIGLFVDEASVAAREALIGKVGVMSGRELAFVFSALRANDLIWSYVVGNYLKGATPEAFDLLYWNADSTNLPGPMFCYYLRSMYLENALREPGRLRMLGESIDLGGLGMPAYVLATREDHIVPWRTAYRSMRLLGGERRFVLGASGHVAGVINPASRNRRSYWHAGNLPEDPDQWLAGAGEQPGSWWIDWIHWLAAFGDGQKPAPARAGGNGHAAIEPAPGRYVKQRVA